jgi:hypothetical protein
MPDTFYRRFMIHRRIWGSDWRGNL